jgi:hypothetical protein
LRSLRTLRLILFILLHQFNVLSNTNIKPLRRSRTFGSQALKGKKREDNGLKPSCAVVRLRGKKMVIQIIQEINHKGALEPSVRRRTKKEREDSGLKPSCTVVRLRGKTVLHQNI